MGFFPEKFLQRVKMKKKCDASSPEDDNVNKYEIETFRVIILLNPSSEVPNSRELEVSGLDIPCFREFSLEYLVPYCNECEC
jgi:hypothetical protein